VSGLALPALAGQAREHGRRVSHSASGKPPVVCASTIQALVRSRESLTAKSANATGHNSQHYGGLWIRRELFGGSWWFSPFDLCLSFGFQRGMCPAIPRL